MKKIVLFTQWFDPEPTFKGLEFAKALQRNGFDVEVVTGVPNYPGGKIYPGYSNKIIQKEKIDNIQITRLWLYPSHDNSALKRIFNYLSFAFSSLIYLLFFMKKANVMYAYHPPLTIGLIAVIVKFFRRIPVVYDIQDMWPDTLESTGMIKNKFILDIIGLVAKFVYHFVDQLVVLSPGFKRILVERSVSEKKIEVIPNWCNEYLLSNTSNQKIPLPGDNEFKILFAGNIGKAQNLDFILENSKKFDSKIDFIFLGNGIAKADLIKKAVELNLKNTYFLNAVSMSEVSSYIESASALLVFLKNDPLFEITIPSKTQAYMFNGKPIIMGVRGDAAEIVSKANCGICIDPSDSNDFNEKLLSLLALSRVDLEQMGKNGKKYYYNFLSFDSGVEKFKKIFQHLSN